MRRLTKVVEVRFPHRVFFVRDVLGDGYPAIEEALEGISKVLPVVEKEVGAAWPGLVDRLVKQLGQRSTGAPLILPGGESVKNSLEAVDQVVAAIEEHGIDRHNAVLCIGGGSLLDVVGFAAAISHRGVRLVRLPTTVLSQADSGVGVKNGINRFGKKNFVGAFAVPHAVVNDLDFLRTLPREEVAGGLVEAVKVAMVKDAGFFAWLEDRLDALVHGDEACIEEAVVRSATLHFDHICDGGDPFEMGSSRPLDFGHWAAHKLEGMVGPSLGHGQAVAIGVALDTVYAREAGLLSAEATSRVLDLIRGLSLPVHHPAMEQVEAGRLAFLSGLDEFREHLGGELTVLLPEAIGRMREVHALDTALVEKSVAFLAGRKAS